MSFRNLLRLVAAGALVWTITACRPMPPIGQQKRSAKRKAPPREMVYTDKTPEQWIEVLGHRNPQARERAIDALVQYGRKSVPPLVELLKSKTSSVVRLGAVRALGQIGPAAQPAIPQLIRLLGDHRWSSRDAAADALAHIGGNDSRVTSALVSTLKSDPDERVRARAARALGRLHSTSSGVVTALARALSDSDAQVQAEAAEALGRLGPGAKAALPALKKAATSDQFIVSQAAGEAIRAITGQ